MIIINDTPKLLVLTAIDKEISEVQKLTDILQLLYNTTEGKERAEKYINSNATLKAILNDWRKAVSSQADFFDIISGSLRTLGMWLPKLRMRIEKDKTSVYDKEVLTFKQKGILDSVSSVNFYTRYATMVIDILLTQATEDIPLQQYLTKLDFTFFNNTYKYFANLGIKFGDSVKSLEDMIENLSDEIYDGVSEEIIKAQLGIGGVSVQKNLAPHELNPLFWWKWAKMKRDVNAIINSHDQVDILAMKIARLEHRRNGTDNPELDRQIEVYQNEVIKNKAKIADIERKYNGG